MKNTNQLIITLLSLHLIIWTALVYYVFIYSDMVDMEMNIKYLVFLWVIIADVIGFIVSRKILLKKLLIKK